MHAFKKAEHYKILKSKSNSERSSSCLWKASWSRQDSSETQAETSQLPGVPRYLLLPWFREQTVLTSSRIRFCILKENGTWPKRRPNSLWGVLQRKKRIGIYEVLWQLWGGGCRCVRQAGGEGWATQGLRMYAEHLCCCVVVLKPVVRLLHFLPYKRKGVLTY